MRRGLQSAWDEHGASLRAPGRAAASLHSTWIELDEALHACSARGGGRSRGVEKGKPTPFLRD